MNDLDIRIKASFKDHRKRKKLAARLGPAGVLALIDLWLTVAETHPDGTLPGYSMEDVELDASWRGKPGAFFAAVHGQWLDDLPGGGFRLHDWEEHQPYIIHAPKRAEIAKRAASARWERRANAQSMPGACPEHAVGMLGLQKSNAPSPDPSPSPVPDPTPKERALSYEALESWEAADYVRAIRALLPGWERLNEAALANALKVEPEPGYRVRAYNDFARDALGALEPIKNPVAMFSAYLRRARKLASDTPQAMDPETLRQMVGEPQ